ncbi:MAG: hypothetical protein ACLSFZ_13530 [Frisingicoccus sp.]
MTLKREFYFAGNTSCNETLNLKTGEKVIDESPMPAKYLGLEREACPN